jgi:hypothetical protein
MAVVSMVVLSGFFDAGDLFLTQVCNERQSRNPDGAME